MGSDVQGEAQKQRSRPWPFLAEVTKIRFRHLGFAFFWAWMSLFMYNKTIFLESEASVLSPQIPLLVLTFSSFLTLVFAMFFLPSTMAPLSLSRLFKILAPTLVIFGTVLRALGDLWVIFDPGIGAIVGSFIAGCGMILTMLMWAEFYGSIGALRAALYMPLSLVLATPLFYLATWAPSGVDIAVMCCFPVLAVLLVNLNSKEIKAKDALSCYAFTQQRVKDAVPQTHLFLPWKICLAAGLYGIISGLVSSTSHISEAASGLTQIGSILVSLLLVIGVLIFGKDPQHDGFTYKPTLLVMVAGCISLLFLNDAQIASVIVSSGYMLFYALSWIMYSDVSFRLNLPSYKVFSSGRTFGALGYAVGMALGYLFSQTLHLDIQQPGVLSALTVCLLLFTAIFVLDEKDVMNTWGKRPQSLSSLDDLASDKGLTPREAEVLGLLAKGRSLPYIQEQLHISHSTANSHAANIYAKLGVHSKQELISLVERESNDPGEKEPSL